MKLILSAAIMSLLSSSAFAVLLTTPTDPILGVQLQTVDGVTTIVPSTAGGTAGTNGFPTGEAPAKAIDGITNTGKYLNFGRLNTGFIVDAADDSLVLSGIELFTANDAPNRDPISFSIYGTNVSQSTTFSDYTLIVANQPILTTDPGRFQSSGLVNFVNPTASAFDSYLVIFPTVRGADNSMQIGEVRLDGSVIPEPSTIGLLGLATAGIAAMRRRRK